MMTGRVIAGNAEAGVIVWTFVPGMLNWMMLVPPPVALADVIAARNEPAPESRVLVTVKVAAGLVRQPMTVTNSPRGTTFDSFTFITLGSLLLRQRKKEVSGKIPECGAHRRRAGGDAAHD